MNRRLPNKYIIVRQESNWYWQCMDNNNNKTLVFIKHIKILGWKLHGSMTFETQIKVSKG